MLLEIKRIAKRDTYTISKWYIDGKYVCDGLEDCDRGLRQDMSLAELQTRKMYGKTAIPAGTYTVKLTYSPRLAGRRYAAKYEGCLPEVCEVKAYTGVRIHCLTPDMEVLTENGWQNLEDFKTNPAKRCYSYNVEKGLIELADITNFIEQEYEGDLYCNEGKRVNYSVTDKHRMFVGTKKRDGSRVWGFRTADDIPYGAQFLTAANKEGEELSARQKVLYRLLMAVQADGYLLNRSMESTAVRFHFRKERKIKRVCELLEELGEDYSIFVDKEQKTHILLRTALSNEIAEYLNPCRYSYNYKELPLFLLNLGSQDLKDLLMEYLFFDGRWENYQKNNKNMIISSTNLNTLNILQAMATCCGMRSYMKVDDHSWNCWALVLYEGQEHIMPNEETFCTKPYKGAVWCLSNPNTTLIVRQNKRPLIIGNCGNTAEDTLGCLLPGYNKVKGKVLQSTECFYNLMDNYLLPAWRRKETITLKIG